MLAGWVVWCDAMILAWFWNGSHRRAPCYQLRAAQLALDSERAEKMKLLDELSWARSGQMLILQSRQYGPL